MDRGSCTPLRGQGPACPQEEGHITHSGSESVDPFNIGWPMLPGGSPWYITFERADMRTCPARNRLSLWKPITAARTRWPINLALKRPVRYMAKKEAFDPVMASSNTSWCAFSSHIPSTANVPARVLSGRPYPISTVGIAWAFFPEGTVFDDEVLHPSLTVAAYFAWKTGVRRCFPWG